MEKKYYKINGVCWDSKNEYDIYSKWLKNKLAKLQRLGYYPYWDHTSNWIKITKKIPDVYNNSMVMILSAKVFNESSKYGINNGHVSKLEIRQRGDYPMSYLYITIWFNYDRGHDIDRLHENKIAKKMYDDFMKIMDEVDQ